MMCKLNFSNISPVHEYKSLLPLKRYYTHCEENIMINLKLSMLFSSGMKLVNNFTSGYRYTYVTLEKFNNPVMESSKLVLYLYLLYTYKNLCEYMNKWVEDIIAWREMQTLHSHISKRSTS